MQLCLYLQSDCTLSWQSQLCLHWQSDCTLSWQSQLCLHWQSDCTLSWQSQLCLHWQSQLCLHWQSDCTLSWQSVSTLCRIPTIRPTRGWTWWWPRHDPASSWGTTRREWTVSRRARGCTRSLWSPRLSNIRWSATATCSRLGLPWTRRATASVCLSVSIYRVCPVLLQRTGAGQAAWRWALCCRLTVPHFGERRRTEASREGSAGGVENKVVETARRRVMLWGMRDLVQVSTYDTQYTNTDKWHCV